MSKTVGRPLGEYDVKRKEIATATWAVIARSGIKGASMRAIAREAGCTTGTLVHYFSNKDELLEYAVSQGFEQLEARIESAMKQDNAIESLREIALSTLPLDAAARGLISAWQSFLAASENNPGMADKIRKILGATHKQATKLVRRGQELNEIRDDFSAEDLADQVNAMNDGLARLASYEPKRLSPKRLIKIVDAQLELLKKEQQVGESVYANTKKTR
ncbi:MAG: TetR/AcrR family transcriptional regulator [Pseudomonadota bacterium]